MPTDKATLASRGINVTEREAREISRGQKYDVSSTIKPCDVLVPSKDKYSSNAISSVGGQGSLHRDKMFSEWCCS